MNRTLTAIAVLVLGFAAHGGEAPDPPIKCSTPPLKRKHGTERFCGCCPFASCLSETRLYLMQALTVARSFCRK